jgi:hypothetical protein
MCKLDRDPFGNVKVIIIYATFFQPQGIGLVKFENYSDARRASTELNGIRLQDELSKAVRPIAYSIFIELAHLSQACGSRRRLEKTSWRWKPPQNLKERNVQKR